MSIRVITIDQLRRMEDQEGLVLQGCVGSTREWLDGINRMLTANGCLKNGNAFTDVHVFQKDGSTCLLFPFSDDVKLDMRKLAIWRARSNERFGSTWLSDYVENELGGYIQEKQVDEQSHPTLLGYSATSNAVELKSVKEVANFICTKGKQGDILIFKTDGQLFIRTFGIYLHQIASQEYREELLKELIPLQMKLENEMIQSM